MKSNLILLFLVFLICAFSVGKIINYYFFYDDFFLFYALQFPTDKDSIFQSPDASAYRFLEPFFVPQFALFGYEPLGYFIISFFLFVVASFVFYFFVKFLTNGDKKVAFFASAIMASGYMGVEALTWNMGAGPNNTLFLILTFLIFIFLLFYIRQKKSLFAFLTIVVFVFTVYFFQFRAFLLFVWLPIFILALFLKKENIPKFSVFFVVVLMILGLIIYKGSFGFNVGQRSHIEIDFPRYVQVYIRNIGNVFFPSEALELISGKTGVAINKLELFAGIAGLSLLILFPTWTFFKKSKVFPLLFFFSTSLLIGLLLVHIVVGLTVNVPDVWYSSHRFYISILPFLAGFLGTLFVVLQRRAGLLGNFLVGFWIVSHVVLSNVAIDARWDNTISHIRYFYKTLRQYVPALDKNSVLLMTQGEPVPVSIFVSARAANAYAGIAGFYSMRTNEFNLATSPQDAVNMLKQLNLSEDSLYSLHYRRGELIDRTKETREILKNGRRLSLGQATSGNSVEFNNLNLPTSTPLYFDAQLSVYPALSKLDLLDKVDQVEIDNPEDYFEILFKQNLVNQNLIAVSEAVPLSFEHEVSNIIDGDYSTTWIPTAWNNNGSSATIDLGVIRKVNRIVWSSSRTSSWRVRSPSEYVVEVSLDGNRFSKVREVLAAPALVTGKFFVDEIPEQDVRFIRLTVRKTHGGLTPALDEVEVFNTSDGNANFNEYFVVKQNPERYLPNVAVARRYLTEVLDNTIDIEISWKVDDNSDYPVGRSKILKVGVGQAITIHELLTANIGKDIKSLRVKPLNFPALIFIRDARIVYSSLQEFSSNE